MRKIIAAVATLCLCGGADAKPTKLANPAKTAIAKLNALTTSDISWNLAKAKSADVTCSGDADRILFGSSKGSVWIGIVPAHAKPQLMDFPVSHGTQT
jgi:hypothetical protein